MTDILWIVPEKQGGIWSYSKTLWPEIKKACELNGLSIAGPIQDLDEVYHALSEHRPKLIHIQHEYSFFGSKTPLLYFFPRWLRQMRRTLPRSKIIATAHVVIPDQYRYPMKGRGWQIPFRYLANAFLLPNLRRLWSQETWGGLDGVIVHSELQVPSIQSAGCQNVKTIPISVFNFSVSDSEKRRQAVLLDAEENTPLVVVFGFISPEKGQDIAVQAMAALSSLKNRSAHLVIAGGGRRKADLKYVQKVKDLIQALGLTHQVTITGFLNEAQAEDILSRATLILAPFRDTTGSASLAQALGRGCAILTSDHPLNLELGRRIPGCLAYFRSEDPIDCAQQMERLLFSPHERAQLSDGARKYSQTYSVTQIAQMHAEFYKTLL